MRLPRPALAAVCVAALLSAGGAGAQAVPLATIDDGPKKQTKKRSAKFVFSSDDPVATFECRLDEEVFEACVTPKVYGGLERGRHSFQVRAVDAAGAVSAPAIQKWKIVRKSK